MAGLVFNVKSMLLTKMVADKWVLCMTWFSSNCPLYNLLAIPSRKQTRSPGPVVLILFNKGLASGQFQLVSPLSLMWNFPEVACQEGLEKSTWSDTWVLFSASLSRTFSCLVFSLCIFAAGERQCGSGHYQVGRCNEWMLYVGRHWILRFSMIL